MDASPVQDVNELAVRVVAVDRLRVVGPRRRRQQACRSAVRISRDQVRLARVHLRHARQLAGVVEAVLDAFATWVDQGRQVAVQVVPSLFYDDILTYRIGNHIYRFLFYNKLSINQGIFLRRNKKIFGF